MNLGLLNTAVAREWRLLWPKLASKLQKYAILESGHPKKRCGSRTAPTLAGTSLQIREIRYSSRNTGQRHHHHHNHPHHRRHGLPNSLSPEGQGPGRSPPPPKFSAYVRIRIRIETKIKIRTRTRTRIRIYSQKATRQWIIKIKAARLIWPGGMSGAPESGAPF